MNGSRKTGGAWQRNGLIVLCAILFLSLIAMIFVTAYVEAALNRINRPAPDNGTLSSSELEDIYKPQDTISPDFSGPTYNATDVVLPTISPDDPIVGGKDVINIMLIGQDRREGESRQRSDSMILCTFNLKKGTITMTSFLRDLYVVIPGYKPTRMNAAYQIGGMRTLDETLAVNFGVHVDANVEVDFFGFMKIIDLLGGVDINLTKAEANYLNTNGNWGVNEYNGEWNLVEGVNRLNSQQALAYSRIRYLDSDFQRTGRQRNVITAILKEYKNQSWTKMESLLWEILPLITTDMTNTEIISYAGQIFPMLANANIVTQRIPASGTYENAVINGDEVLVPDLIANRNLLLQTIMAD